MNSTAYMLVKCTDGQWKLYSKVNGMVETYLGFVFLHEGNFIAPYIGNRLREDSRYVVHLGS